MRPISILFCAMLLLSGCTHKPVVVKRAFYYWKSAPSWIEIGEEKARDSLRAPKLYLKLFDVGPSPLLGAIPIAKTQLRGLPHVPPDSARPELVPTVFIDNEALNGLPQQGVDTLAANIHFLVLKTLGRIDADRWRIDELQIDCDWSEPNRDHYFSLLRQLKRRWSKRLSCTLRFYPYKYRDRMGVPPVDRVMLMCYNLLNPLTNPDRNTILETSELKGYLGRRRSYPLPFDVALPVYARMQLYQHGRFVKVIRSEEPEILPLLRKTKPLWYEVTADTVLDDTYLRRGDAIKYESVTPPELRELTDLLRERLVPEDSITIALYHLDEANLKRYPYESLEAAYRTFDP